MKEIIIKGVQKVGHEIAKNSPGILTGVAVAGIPTLICTSFVAGMKTKEVIIEKEIKEGDIKEEAKAALPYLLLPIGIGVGIGACAIGAVSISTRRQAAAASLYALSEKTLKEVEEKYIEQNSEKKLEKLHDDINADRVRNNPPKEEQVIITGNGDTLCYDSLSGRYFKMDIERIRRIQNTVNEKLNAGEFISVNDFGDMLGLPDTDLGWDLGWSLNVTGLIDIRFTSCLTEDGTPALVIEHKNKPEVKYAYDI